MDRLNSGKLNTCSANWELNLSCYVDKGVLLVPILSQLNPQDLCLLYCGSVYPLPGVFGGTCFLYIQGRRTLEMDAIGFSNTFVVNARLDITSQKTVTQPFYMYSPHLHTLFLAFVWLLPGQQGPEWMPNVPNWKTSVPQLKHKRIRLLESSEMPEKWVHH